MREILTRALIERRLEQLLNDPEYQYPKTPTEQVVWWAKIGLLIEAWDNL